MRIFFCCLLFCITANCTAGVFDFISFIPAKQRLTQTQSIYNDQVKHKDSVFAIASIKELISLANDLDDKQLQCLSISLLADQYARTRALNDLSTELHKQAIEKAERYRL